MIKLNTSFIQKNLKQVLIYRLTMKKVHKVIKLNEKPLTETYINMNNKLRQKAKNNFEKDYFKIMNN